MLNPTLACLTVFVAVDANIPANLDELETMFYAKFRVAKTHKELKRELAECK